MKRKTWVTLLGVVLLAAGVSALVVHGGSGRAQPGVALVAGISDPVQAADKTLSQELRDQNLSVQDVACIKNGRAYRGHPVIRCNVNFGDPHIVAYCTVIVADRLLTSHQDPAIPCGPDLSGSKPLMYPPSG
jgi:hypothetical protein